MHHFAAYDLPAPVRLSDPQAALNAQQLTRQGSQRLDCDRSYDHTFPFVVVVRLLGCSRHFHNSVAVSERKTELVGLVIYKL